MRNKEDQLFDKKMRTDIGFFLKVAAADSEIRESIEIIQKLIKKYEYQLSVKEFLEEIGEI
jgi:hypothetical protein